MHTWDTGVSAAWRGRGRHSVCGSGTVWGKQPVCRSSMDTVEMCQLIERQVRGCHRGGYTPFETPRAVTNLHTHTHTETIACSAFHRGRHTFNQRKLDCRLCLCMRVLWTSNQIVSFCITHCTVSYCIGVYHIVSYHVISCYYIALHCI